MANSPPHDSNKMGIHSPKRFEDKRFLTGSGCFTDDIPNSRQLHMIVVRSAYAHATIRAIGVSEAELPTGVVGVHTSEDLVRDNIGPLPCVAQLDAKAPLVVPPRMALARDRVRHVGEPVAIIIAESVEAGEAAADAIDIDYAPLPSVVDARAALTADAPQIWLQAPGNVACHVQKGDAEAVARAFANAAHCVEASIDNHRVAALPTETRAGIAEYDQQTENYILTLTAQGVHGIRNQLAEPVLRVAAETVTVRAPDVGGGFGMKNFLYPEWVLLAWAAKRYGRAIRWSGSRAEDFQGACHGRGTVSKVRLAVDSDGRFLALAAEMVADMGAYLSAVAPQIPARSAATAMAGVYAIPAVYMDLKTVFTNTTPIDAYRGAGKPEANFMIERLVDMAAAKLGRDPLTLRLQNAISDYPYRSALGIEIDSGQIRTLIQTAQKKSEAAPLPAATARTRHCLYGRGFACFLETARGAPEEGAAIRFEADGTVGLYPGTESNGQGHETTFRRLVAEKLGVAIDYIHYHQADTRQTTMGHGHGGARSMHMGGTAIMVAIDKVLGKARIIAGELLQADPRDLVFQDGRFQAAVSGQSVALLDVAAAARSQETEAGTANGLDSFGHRSNAPFTFPMGCHRADVEVDRDTGMVRLLQYAIVDDYGTMLNPHLTAGQVHGGVTQGIGQALMERIVYDSDTGQLLTGSFMDYAIPRADDVPSFDVLFQGNPTAANPLGVKGSGQAGSIAAAQTVVNAVLNALQPFGITHLDMPLTSERIWRALQQTPSPR